MKLIYKPTDKTVAEGYPVGTLIEHLNLLDPFLAFR